jgi:hypothetical protein
MKPLYTLVDPAKIKNLKIGKPEDLRSFGTVGVFRVTEENYLTLKTATNFEDAKLYDTELAAIKVLVKKLEEDLEINEKEYEFLLQTQVSLNTALSKTNK